MAKRGKPLPWEKDKLTLLMRDFRNELRNYRKRVRNDPYLSDIADDFELCIVSWDKKRKSVLVRCRDKRVPITEYDSKLCRYEWINLGWRFMYWHILKMANDILCEMRMQRRSN